MATRTVTYAAALLQAWEQSPPTAREAVVDRFVSLLRRDRATALAPNVVRALAQLVAERAQRAAVVAELARTPTAQEHAALTAHGVTEFRTAPDIVGGVRIVSERRTLDGSVTGGLGTVRRALLAD
jgi:F0F1-type ATP synthase delta subunit